MAKKKMHSETVLQCKHTFPLPITRLLVFLGYGAVKQFCIGCVPVQCLARIISPTVYTLCLQVSSRL